LSRIVAVGSEGTENSFLPLKYILEFCTGGIMKRTFIRATLMLLAVLAVSAGVKAQSSQQYSADIPFDFEARGERHAAGKYRLGSMSVTSPGAIGLREVRSGNVRILGISSDASERDWSQPGTLTFLKVNGRYLLSAISTATFKMDMKVKKQTGRGDNDVASAGRIVKINLN
jgi:hypothetical protein